MAESEETNPTLRWLAWLLMLVGLVAVVLGLWNIFLEDDPRGGASIVAVIVGLVVIVFGWQSLRSDRAVK